METVLRLFWPRAVLGLCFFGFVILVAFAGVAAAQEAGPVTVDQIAAPAAPEGSTKDMIDLVFSSAAAGAMSLGAILMAFLAKQLPAWVTPIIDYITTSEADRWERLTTTALDKAEAYARQRYDAFKDRAGYVNAMATFLAMFNREIVQFADQNGNGIIDLIETRLPALPGKSPTPAAAAVDPLPLASRRGVKQKEASH